jgi:hypothetical protein
VTIVAARARSFRVSARPLLRLLSRLAARPKPSSRPRIPIVDSRGRTRATVSVVADLEHACAVAPSWGRCARTCRAPVPCPR